MAITVVTVDTEESWDVGEHTITVTTITDGGVASADHGNLAGLADDDHPQYALADGSRGDFEPTGAAASAITDHVNAADPHTQYITASETISLTNKTLDDYSNNIHADAVHRHVKNASGTTIAAGVPVMFNGYNAGEDAVEVVPADHELGVAIGITESAINNGEFGLITVAGILEGIDTSAYTAGQILYVNGAGLLTGTEPTTGYSQPIAFVLSAKNNGAIQVLAAYPKQSADDVRFAPAGNIAATTVQSAIEELDSEKEPSNANIQSHIATVTGNPHAVTKSDVGLGNVPNVDTTNADNITSGTIALARLPQGSLERQINVADQSARYALTTTDVQNGDVVKQLDTGIMYRVVDDTQLGNSAGYSEFVAGIAAQVDWSGVINKPDPTITLTGDATGSGTMTDLGSVSITTTVGNDSHTHTHSTLPADILVDTDIGVAVQAYSTVLSATTASFTTTDETKLDGIEAGAEVNNISDVNATDLTDGSDSSLHYHSADRYRVNHTGTQLLSTISDAGTMAAQDATSVNIDGGTIDSTTIGVTNPSTGAFTTLDSDTLTTDSVTHPAFAGKTFYGVGTVVDSLVYDTSLDTDGGAWRHRCSDTSWYQEIVNEDASYLGSMTTTVRDTLSPSDGDLIYNTTTATWQKYIVSADYIGEHNGQSGWQNTTRGIRAEFPAVVAVIAEAAKVWIFDVTGSEPVLWMRFVTDNSLGSVNSFISWATGSPVTVNSVALANGILCVVTNFGGFFSNLISDVTKCAYYNTPYGLVNPLADRNTPPIYNSNGWAIVGSDYSISDVAITTLPNAAIDPDTGLPYPTIAVATNGNGTYSTSIIKDDGTVINVASDSTGTAVSCDFGSDGSLTVVRSDGTVYVWDSCPTTTGQSPDTTITDALGTVSIVEAA